MKRSFLGILVVSLIFACLIASSLAAAHADMIPRFLESGFLNLPVGILALSLSTYLHFFIPLLIISTLLVLFLHLLRCLSWQRATFGGAVFGAGLAAALNFADELNSFSSGLTTILSAAICGWIYWWIATGGRLKAPLA
jgi:hypothetical protein